jgi:hypothetical protein
MTTESKTLADALPIEQARCRELLTLYKEIGAAGTLGALMIEQALQRADKAVMSADVVAMLRSYEELRGLE